MLSCQYIFCVVYGMGLVGIWMSKLTMECVIVTLQSLLIDCSDWRAIAKLS